mgnify:CR=1 FL=1
MTTTHKLLFGIGSLVLVTALIAYWYIGSKVATIPANTRQGATITPGTQPSTADQEQKPLAEGRTLKTNDAGALVTADFLTDADVSKDPYNADSYFIGYHEPVGMADSSATRNPPFTISYDKATDFFNVALLKEPIGPTRQSAETYLQSKLNIPEDQMCRLQYSVSVPNRINSLFSSINLGFSFCPGATKLPE